MNTSRVNPGGFFHSGVSVLCEAISRAVFTVRSSTSWPPSVYQIGPSMLRHLRPHCAKPRLPERTSAARIRLQRDFMASSWLVLLNPRRGGRFGGNFQEQFERGAEARRVFEREEHLPLRFGISTGVKKARQPEMDLRRIRRIEIQQRAIGRNRPRLVAERLASLGLAKVRFRDATDPAPRRDARIRAPSANPSARPRSA